MAIIDKGGRFRERCQAKVLAVLEVNCLQDTHTPDSINCSRTT